MAADLAILHNCVLLRSLYYDIPNHIWLQVDPEGSTVTLGLTDVAQTTAGNMLIVSYRPTGRHFSKGKAVAVVESSKWLGPLRTPVAGTLVEVNENLPEDAGLINRSPYCKGWLVRMSPDDLPADLSDLVTGEVAITMYGAFMAEKNLDDCIHCEGYELP